VNENSLLMETLQAMRQRLRITTCACGCPCSSSELMLFCDGAHDRILIVACSVSLSFSFLPSPRRCAVKLVCKLDANECFSGKLSFLLTQRISKRSALNPLLGRTVFAAGVVTLHKNYFRIFFSRSL
jgi:hypothetical protein